MKHSTAEWGPYGRRTCACGERFDSPDAQAQLDAHIAANPDGPAVGWAIRVIAQHVLAVAARDEDVIDWGLYPEVGQADWDRVIDRLDDIAPYPLADDYEQAYALLKARSVGAPDV